ncbi:MAG: T9SS type A sorting domain-containing protein [Bacteroidetes bacterium]|nr:T9SS type A sorting domain-containing protein [Bacteroidota bacterium]
MKKIILTGFLFLLLGNVLFSQSQLSWRVVNPRIIRISGTDRLEFEIQVKSNIAGYFGYAMQANFYYNSSALGTTITAVRAGVSAYKNVVDDFAYQAPNANYNSNKINVYVPADHYPYDPENELLSEWYCEISTEWQTFVILQCQVLDNTLESGIYFHQSTMNPQQFYQDPNSANQLLFTNPSLYDETKSLRYTYLGRIYSDSKGWSQVGGSTNGVQYLNWTTARNTSVWDGNGHVQHADGKAINLRIHPYGGTLTVDPDMGLSCSGTTEINGIGSFIIQSTSTGSGAFIDNGTITYLNSGSVRVERYFTDPEVGLYNHLVSAPMQNATLASFRMWSNPNHSFAYTWNEPNNEWDNPYVPSTPVPVLQGLSVGNDVMSGDKTCLFSGSLYTGAQTRNVTKSDIGSNPNYNLVGNPYPSPIDWDASSGWQDAGVSTSIWIWNPSVSQFGVYVRGNGGIGTNGVSNIIPLGQGFYVQATQNNYAFGMNNAVRKIDTKDFLKETPANILKIRVDGSQFGDESLVLFKPDASTGFDPDYDGYKFDSWYSESPDMCTRGTDGTRLSINTYPPSTDHVTIPLDFHPKSDENFTITASLLESFSNETTIYIEDLKDNVWQQLKGENGNPVYAFSAVVGDVPGRFLIHFYGPTAINDLTSNSINIYSYGKFAYIMNPTEENIQRVEVYDMRGNLVMTTKVARSTLSKFAINHPSAYYLIKVITDKGIASEKVYIGVM